MMTRDLGAWNVVIILVFLISNVACNDLRSQKQLVTAEIRRKVSAVTGLILLQQSTIPKAFAAGTKEKISTIASFIPGYGQKDVIYPSSFVGNWDCDVQVTSSQISPSYDPSIRFLQPELSSNIKDYKYRAIFQDYEGNVVKDRRLTWQSQIPSYLPSTSDLKNPLVFWDASNPNQVNIKTPNDDLDILVTKRSIEGISNEEDPFAFGYSEFARITQNTPKLSLPLVYGYRILARFKRGSSDNEVVGVLREYLYTTDKDNVLLDNTDKPSAIVKSTINMQRIV